MCEHITHPETWPGDVGDLYATDPRSYIARVSSDQFERMMDNPARPSDKLRSVIRERQEARGPQVTARKAAYPIQMTAEELEAALKEIITETGATSGKDMGKVMGVASKKLAGLAEGRAISAKVKELLG